MVAGFAEFLKGKIFWLRWRANPADWTSMVMVSLARATLRMKSTVCFLPSAEDTASFCCDSKPSASTLTEYGPGFSCGKLNRPESSVAAFRFSPVSLLVTVTVARGTAPRLYRYFTDDCARSFALGDGHPTAWEKKRSDNRNHRQSSLQHD
jgi:hypothetical protein